MAYGSDQSLSRSVNVLDDKHSTDENVVYLEDEVFREVVKGRSGSERMNRHHRFYAGSSRHITISEEKLEGVERYHKVYLTDSAQCI